MALYDNQQLKVYNSLTGKKEVFTPLLPGRVGMYVCGPTVYSNVHLGNARTFISFDMIFRYLRHLGYQVRYVRNITDAGHLTDDADQGEDKIAKKARLEQLEPMEIVQRYTLDFRQVMRQFNAIPPSIEPTATGHIVEQIQTIQKIIDQGLAYEVNGSVYFDVNSFNKDHHYGELSGRQVEDMIANTRELTAQGEKRNPQDFALWKKAAPEHIMQWPSPWGDGFPGWHLECTVMSNKYLGEQFDIHGGGMDLKFPHHECEIAQAKAAHWKAPVRYWLHANMLTLNGKKMSKSTGNSILPVELFTGDNDFMEKGFSPSVVRFFIMQAHYRSVLDFSNDAIMAAEKGYQRLTDAMATLEEIQATATHEDGLVNEWQQRCYAAMNDDFNTPLLIAAMFDGVKLINQVKSGQQSLTQEALAILQEQFKLFFFDILGLNLATDSIGEGTAHLDAAMQVLIDLRAQARSERNFALSDQIRDQLAASGITLKDGPEGTAYTINE